jgi:hypothetical protein
VPNEFGSKSSRLTIVDLAGSERCKETNAEGQVFEEGKAINLQLLHLKNLISAL